MIKNNVSRGSTASKLGGSANLVPGTTTSSGTVGGLATFERLESNVRCYSRSFPKIFTRSKGDILFDQEGNRYIDFFAGAGALNYGHNPPAMKKALLEYLESDGITHSLDLATQAKEEFLLTLEESILQPRGLSYKVMFPGPTGTNAVEAALKLARLYTGRTEVISFTNAFHGMTLGALATTGSKSKREGAGVGLPDVTRMPFCGYLGDELDTLDLLERHLSDASSGLDLPAALILETVQAEGGVNIAEADWLQRLSQILQKYSVLLIVDDIQVGCGRTGPFFSFERAGIKPDIVCLSKSLSGYGSPFSLVLMKPELDIWEPGKHNGTFRGNNMAFVTGKVAIENFWTDDQLTLDVKRKGDYVQKRLTEFSIGRQATVRGLGLIQAIEFADSSFARQVSKRAFAEGLLVETAGPEDEVLKILPPLNVEFEHLEAGMNIIGNAIELASVEDSQQRKVEVSGK